MKRQNWNDVEFSTIVEDGAFGPRFSGKNYAEDGNIATLRTTDLSADGTISYSTMPLARLDETKFANHFLQHGDIVISRSGRIGTTAIFEGHPIPVLPGAFLIRFRLHGDTNPEFYTYWFNSPLGQQRIMSVARGAAQQNINLTNVLKLPVPLPPLPTQGRIVAILSAYDDLIENNRRRIELLEQSARLLYKEWFVHLRFPGHEHTPPTNGVPEGWEEGEVADFYKTASGGTPRRNKPEYYIGDIQWVKTKELPNGFILETEEHINEDGLKSSSAKLFPKNTLLLALYGATIGELGILAREASTNQACCAIMPKDGRGNIIHSYLFFRENKNNLVSLSGGAAQNNISQQIVRGFPMCMTNSTVMGLFVEKLQPVFDQWINLEHQSRRLTKARDLLLPRLMNGEIVV